MRKFLITSASATFFGNSLYTARIMIEAAVCKVYNYNIGIYAKIQKNCPVRGWVEGLEEVWQ